jgi:hypothetical protein
MTRKDYEIVATAIAQAVWEAVHGNYTGDKTANGITEHIEHAFQVDNPRFNPRIFRAFMKKKYDEMRL